MMTRKQKITKWLCYALCFVVLLVVQAQVLPYVQLWGLRPLLLPCIPAAVATFERRRSALLFAFFTGLFCELIFYSHFDALFILSFLAAALLGWLTAKYIIMPGLYCSLIAAAQALLACGLIHALLFAYSHAGTFGSAVLLSLRQSLISAPTALLVHPLVAAVAYRFRRSGR